MNEKDKKFKILSIDGGGIRGIIPAKILYQLEEEAIKNDGSNARLCDYFDLICGTSTGGIIAIGIALGMKAKDILKLYQENAKAIFPSKNLLRAFRKNEPFYSREPLEELLAQQFNSFNYQTDIARIYDCKTRLCIPTYDLDKGEQHVFKTDHLCNYRCDCHIPVVKAALATAAAPAYFSPYSFAFNDMNSVNRSYYYNNVDGGVIANNPALIGLTEATYCMEIPTEDIMLLSLGTGSFNLKDTNINKKRGLRYWLCPSKNNGLRIYEVMSSGQSVYIHNTLKLMSDGAGHDHKGRFEYHRIQKSLEANIPMDATDKETLDRLANIGQDLFKQNVEVLLPFIQNKVEQYHHKTNY